MPPRALNTSPRILLAGGSGFIGSALAAEFSTRGYQVVILTRSPRQRGGSIKEVAWDGQRLGEWIQFLDGADAVINLAGQSAQCLYTPENLRLISASRVDSVRAIAAGCEYVKQPPRVWVQASAIGYYGETGGDICDENSPGGGDALAEVCKQWEGAFNAVSTPKTRRVLLRIGFALGNGGGGLPVLARLTKLFLGGRAGHGRQYVSWIHIADLAAMFIAAVEEDKYSGVYNAVAPAADTNAELMRELRHAWRRPWSPPVPAFVVRLGARIMGMEASMILGSCRVAPRRFLADGFRFQFPDLGPALRDLCQNKEK